MPAINRILTSARIDLGEPEYPNNRILLDHLFRRNQFYVNDLRMTDEGWMLQQFPLDLTGATDVVPVTAAGFAGSYSVHTNPAYYADGRMRDVDVVRKQDLHLVATPDRLISVGGDLDSVAAMAFYAEGSDWKAQVKPSNAVGHYTVWYEPGLIAETSIENLPQMLQQFWPLLATATACDALSVARWPGYEADGNQAQRGSMAPRLAEKEAMLYDQFKKYIRNVNQPKTKFRRPFETSPGAANPYRRFFGG